MKVTNSLVDTLAREMRNNAQEQRATAFEKALKSPALKREAAKWHKHLQKLPSKLLADVTVRNLSEEVIMKALVENNDLPQVESFSTYEHQIRLAAIEAKDINHLKSKLKLQF